MLTAEVTNENDISMVFNIHLLAGFRFYKYKQKIKKLLWFRQNSYSVRINRRFEWELRCFKSNIQRGN